MSSLQLTLEKLVQSLLRRMEDNESRETDLLLRFETSIQLCEESLHLLRQWVTENSFPDKASEIYFFKQVKPLILARYIYYQKAYHLHIAYFNGCGLLEKERLTRELQDIDRFFVANNNLYEYYRKGCTHLDEVYFLRERHDWKNCPGIPRIGDVFSTGADEQLASLMAHEQLLKYIDGLLENPPAKQQAPIARSVASSELRCTASVTSIVELGYALYASGFFNNGKASVKNIMTFLEESLRIDLGKYYDTFIQIQERKINTTKFLDELKTSLLRYIDRERN